MDNTVAKYLGLVATLLVAPCSQAENLLEVYQSARTNDPNYLAAIAEYDAAREAAPQAWSAVYPQINFQGTHSEVDEERTLTGTGTVTNYDYDSDTYVLSLKQTIYNQKQFDRISQAGAEVAVAEAGLNNAGHELILRAAQTYFDVLGAQDNLRFAQAEKNAIEQQLRQTRERFKVGLTAITDVHEAQARFDQAVASEIEASNNYATSLEALRVITNTRPSTLASLSEQAPLVAPDPADIDAWVKTALDNNLQLIAADKTMQAARHGLGVARSDHYPSLDLQANRTDHETGGGQFGAFEQEGTTVSLVLNVPLFAGGAVNSASRQAAANYERSRQNHELQRRTTVSQARNNYLTVISNISRVQALKQALRSSKTALDATQAGYEVGTRTAVDVLDSQRELFRAERDYARARYDYILGTLRLKQAAGTLSENDLKLVNDWLKP